MEYEWDTDKDAENLAKHDVDFAEAEDFDWNTALIEEDNRCDYGERRFGAYGLIHDRLYFMVFTMRGERIRIISLRRANKREVRRYGENKTAIQ